MPEPPLPPVLLSELTAVDPSPPLPVLSDAFTPFFEEYTLPPFPPAP